MNITQLKAVLNELAKIKKPQDLIEIEIANNQFTCLLLEKIVYPEILADGNDTSELPTKLKIQTVNNQNPELANKEYTISILDIVNIKVVNI